MKDKPIRELGKKSACFKWTNEHQNCLDKIRITIEMDIGLEPFNINFMDSSLSGVGYMLIQVTEEDKVSVIACGSTGLKDVQTIYSIYDLKLLAIVFACTELKDYMNRGLPFTILTDCKELDKLEKINLEGISS